MVEPASLFGSVAARDALRHEAETFVAVSVTMLRRARALVLGDRVKAIGLLTARRTVLAAHLQRYQQFKHGRIFDPVIRHGTASSQIVARTMKIDCMELGEAFAAYDSRWMRVKSAEWPGYRHDMLALVDVLLKHLEAELRAIRQLLMISDLYAGPEPVPAKPVLVPAS